MRFTAFFALALPIAAQSWDPKMPESVPAVSGRVIEAATFRYIDVKVGDGAAAQPGEQYTVDYTGWLRDGTKFDTSISKEPIVFVQGRRQVIAGWEMGFEGMRVGGKRRLFIPYQLAYGEQGRGSIPPKAELIFDVELLKTEPAPAAAATADIYFSLKSLEREITQLAEAIPEEKYGWAPGPGVRSFQQVFLHIAYGNHLMLRGAAGDAPSQIEEIQRGNEAQENRPINKAATLAALRDSFAEIHEYLDKLSARALAQDIEFQNTKTTRHAWLIWIDTHMGEHLGQAIAYARMNGIVPPWSK